MDTESETIKKYDFKQFEDAIADCKKDIDQYLVQESTNLVDIRILQSIWTLNAGKLCINPTSVEHFCQEVRRCLSNPKSYHNHWSAMNVVITIIFIYMTEDERDALRLYLKQPGDVLPTELKKYGLPIVKHFINFMDTSRMETLMKAVLLTLEALRPNKQGQRSSCVNFPS